MAPQHPACDDCPIGNRAPEHKDHDPTRGPCPNVDDCDKECRAFTKLMDEDLQRGPAATLRCKGCGSVALTHLPYGATQPPPEWASWKCGACRRIG